MSADVFVDTNVLVYVRDASDLNTDQKLATLQIISPFQTSPHDVGGGS